MQKKLKTSVILVRNQKVDKLVYLLPRPFGKFNEFSLKGLLETKQIVVEQLFSPSILKQAAVTDPRSVLRRLLRLIFMKDVRFRGREKMLTITIEKGCFNDCIQLAATKTPPLICN